MLECHSVTREMVPWGKALTPKAETQVHFQNLHGKGRKLTPESNAVAHTDMPWHVNTHAHNV